MPCAIGTSHTPRPPHSDFHHIIPQAWQRILKGEIFDPRTVEVCPNHHRLIHESIVALMKDNKLSKISPVAQYAYLALNRYKEAGGDLQRLKDLGELGYQ
jgi:hypothetical protein